jgi:PhzF family phenazine biosynthesis protein
MLSGVRRPFGEIDVFTSGPFRGNPVAVVFVGVRLTTEQKQRFAAWVNRYVTPFVLPA